MKLNLVSVIPAERDRVFAALIDPEILRLAIPGCESLTETGPDEYAATLKIGAAGLKGIYNGKTTIADKRPPEALTLKFEGKGAPGFVRGSAAIVLSDDAHGTRVACDADVVVGGLVAAVGSRLIEATARKLSEVFFGQLARELVMPSRSQGV
jgi:carbon monoxide dehydrogenase subunit G